MRLKDKVALVTGASSDIGEIIVKRFVEEGASVVLLGRNIKSLDKVRKSVGNEDSTVSLTCDLTDEAQVMQAIDQVMDSYGKIDILVGPERCGSCRDHSTRSSRCRRRARGVRAIVRASRRGFR